MINNFLNKKNIIYIVLLNFNILLTFSLLCYILKNFFNFKYNFSGIIGYYLSNFLINKGLGITTITLPITISIIIINNLFFKKKINISNILIKNIIILFIIPIIFSFTSPNDMFLIGYLGMIISKYIKYSLGTIGCILILFNMILFLYYNKL